MGHLHLQSLNLLGKFDSLAVRERTAAAWLVDTEDFRQEVEDRLALVEGGGRD